MNIRGKFIYVTGFIVLLTISATCTQINDVPSLDNLSQSQALDTLNKSGFAHLFTHCFSNEVKKHYIIPGSQDPEAGTPLEIGQQVKASLSLGPLPVVIGMSEDEAKYTFEDFNVPVEIVQGRNSTYSEGYIYDQSPIKAGCTYPNFKIKLFNSTQLKAVITSPENDVLIFSNNVLVNAKVSPYLLPGEHLWIAVKPYKSTGWYPQSGGPIVFANGELEGYAHLLGDPGDEFEIAILLLDDNLNKKFEDYERDATKMSDWIPITQGDTSISKDIIEKRKLASVAVTLSTYSLGTSKPLDLATLPETSLSA